MDSARYYSLLGLSLSRSQQPVIGMVRAMQSHGYVLHKAGEFDSALYYYHRSYDICPKNQKEALAKYDYLVGMVYSATNNFDSAYYYLTSALEKCKRLGLKQEMSSAYLNLGIVHAQRDRTIDAAGCFYEALKLKEQLLDSTGIARCYLNLSNIYERNNQTRLALDFARKSLLLRLRLNINDAQTIGVYNSIGISYGTLEQYDSSIRYFHEGILQAKRSGAHLILGKLYTNISESLDKIGLTDSAFFYLDAAIAIFADLNNDEGLMYCYNNKSNIYLRRKDYDQSATFAQKSFAIAREVRMYSMMASNVENLYEIAKKQGKYRDALTWLELYKEYKDTVSYEKSQQELKALKFEHALSDRDHQIQVLSHQRNLQMRKAKEQKALTYGAAALAVIILIFSIVYYREARSRRLLNESLGQKNLEIARQSEKLESLNALKSKVISVMSHDMRSPLSSLYSVMELVNSEQLTPEEQKFIFGELSKSVGSVSILLENILGWVNTQMIPQHELSLDSVHLLPVAEEIIQLYSPVAAQKDVRLINKICPTCYVLANKDNLSLVLRNLVNNAIKFSYPGHEVVLQSSCKEKEVKISVTDTGVGMTAEEQNRLFNVKTLHTRPGTNQEKGTGLGLLFVKESIEQLNGTLSLRSEKSKGTTFTFTLPEAAPKLVTAEPM